MYGDGKSGKCRSPSPLDVLQSHNHWLPIFEMRGKRALASRLVQVNLCGGGHEELDVWSSLSFGAGKITCKVRMTYPLFWSKEVFLGLDENFHTLLQSARDFKEIGRVI